MTVEVRQMELSEQSLPDLASIINEENRAAEEIARAADEAMRAAVAKVAEQAAEPWIAHAVRTGEALIEARKRIPRGEWYHWLKSETEINPDSAGKYIRVATYRAELPSDPAGGRNEVLALLSGLPNATPLDMYSDEVKVEVRRLHAEGLSAKDIRQKVGGVSLTTIREWTDPEYRKQRLQQANERRRAAKARRRAHAEMTEKARLALEAQQERQRRDAAAKRAGGDISEVYSLLRKLTAAVERAAVGSVDRGHAKTLRSANHQLFRIEDDVVKILGVDH